MLEPVQDETRYKVMSKLLDIKLLKVISYIKDDRDRANIMMIKAQVKAYESVMSPLIALDEEIAKEAAEIIGIYSQHVTDYLEGMMIRKGWRPEQIATILASEEKQRKRMSMGLFDDEQSKGVKDLAKLQG